MKKIFDDFPSLGACVLCKWSQCINKKLYYSSENKYSTKTVVMKNDDTVTHCLEIYWNIHQSDQKQTVFVILDNNE